MATLDKTQIFVTDTDGMVYPAERQGDNHYRIVLFEPFVGSVPVNLRLHKRDTIAELPSVYYRYDTEWVLIPF